MCEPSNEIDPGVMYTFSTTPTVNPYDATVVDVKIGSDFRFKPFFAGNGILIDETTNVGGITITATGASSGYTFSTLPGGDASLVGSLVGTDFRFRGLSAGQNIVFDNTNPNFLQISSLPFTYSTLSVPSAAATVVGTMLGNDFRFRPLIAGTGIGLDTLTIPNGIIISNTIPSDTFSTLPVVGVTATVVSNKVSNDFRFKGFIPGTNITIDQTTTPNAITISSAQYTYSDATVTGVSIRDVLTGTDFGFKRLIAGSNITLSTATPGAVTISTPTPPVYTYSSNIVPGSDANITATQVGNDFRFKPLNAGTNTTIEETTLPGAVTINSIQPTYSSNVVPGSDANITATQVGNDFRFKPLNAGTNVTIEETTLPGAVTINATQNIYTYSSNIVPGSDADITAAQVGNDFRFKPLNAGTNTTIEETTLPGAVTINGPTYASNTIVGTVPITDAQVGNQFRFKPLSAGNNVTLDAVTTPGAVIISTPTPPVYTYSSNVVAGSDADITATQVGNDFRFKPLNAGVNTTIEETTLPGAVTINGPTYASNVIVGSDANITATQVGNQFRFKPLNGGTNVTVEETTLPGAITFNGPTYSSNVVAGSDANITATQVGNDFRFKPLNAGVNTTIEETTLPGAITFNGPTYSSNVVAGSDANITATQVGNDFRFKPLNAGTNVTIEETTLPGAITINSANPPVYTYSSNVVAGSDANITAAQVGNDFRFKPLNAGTNITIEETTLPGAVTINATLATVSIPQNNILYVDTQFGNNATAQRESLNLAFQTISAALSSALAGDTIYVLPGSYTGISITPTISINMYLSSGVTITGSAGVNVFTINSGITFELFGDGIVNNNLLATVAGSAVLTARSLSGTVTVTGSLVMKAISYTSALINMNTTATSILMNVDIINATGRLLISQTGTAVSNFTCYAQNITCQTLFTYTGPSSNIRFIANNITCTSTTTSDTPCILADNSASTTAQSLCYAEVIANSFIVNNSDVVRVSSSNKSILNNIAPLMLFKVANLTINSSLGGTLFNGNGSTATTIGKIQIECGKIAFVGSTANGPGLFSNNVCGNVGYLSLPTNTSVPNGVFISNITSGSSSVTSINIGYARIHGFFNGGTFVFDTVSSNGQIVILRNTTITAKSMTISNNTDEFIQNSSGNTVNLNVMTLNIPTPTATSIINDGILKITAGTIVSNNTAIVQTNNAGSTYITADSITGMIFAGTAATSILFLNVRSWLLGGTSTALSGLGPVNADIGTVTITENVFDTATDVVMKIGIFNITSTTATGTIITNGSSKIYSIGRLNYNVTASRSFYSLSRTNMTIDYLNITNASNASYMFLSSAGATFDETFTFKTVKMASATSNALFFRKTSGGNTVITVENMFNDVTTNFSRLFENQSALGRMYLNIIYARIDSELLRCDTGGHITYLHCGRVECTTSNNLISNSVAGTLEFGGNMKTAGNHILSNASNALVTVVTPSKFVSGNNCILSVPLITVFFAPTVSKNGVNILQVSAVPLGNLTVAAAMN